MFSLYGELANLVIRFLMYYFSIVNIFYYKGIYKYTLNSFKKTKLS